MQNTQKKYVKPFAVCRIVQGSDFAYSAYVCTPHFADVGEGGKRGEHLGRAHTPCSRACFFCPASAGTPRLGPGSRDRPRRRVHVGRWESGSGKDTATSSLSTAICHVTNLIVFRTIRRELESEKMCSPARLDRHNTSHIQHTIQERQGPENHKFYWLLLPAGIRPPIGCQQGWIKSPITRRWANVTAQSSYQSQHDP
jgi:hypothetical protein